MDFVREVGRKVWHVSRFSDDSDKENSWVKACCGVYMKGPHTVKELEFTDFKPAEKEQCKRWGCKEAYREGN